jgi:hypothetical protein
MRVNDTDHIHTYTHSCKHTCIQNTHTYTHIHTNTLIHTHTHTHTHILTQWERTRQPLLAKLRRGKQLLLERKDAVGVKVGSVYVCERERVCACVSMCMCERERMCV